MPNKLIEQYFDKLSIKWETVLASFQTAKETTATTNTKSLEPKQTQLKKWKRSKWKKRCTKTKSSSRSGKTTTHRTIKTNNNHIKVCPTKKSTITRTTATSTSKFPSTRTELECKWVPSLCPQGPSTPANGETE